MPDAPKIHQFNTTSILTLRADGRGWFCAGALTRLTARPELHGLARTASAILADIEREKESRLRQLRTSL